MPGLYTRFNLSEDGLNASEALQKLYAPQIQNDVRLFAYSATLESRISSPTQIFALLNSPISDLSGNTSLRTKFLTSSYAFSNNNSVWFETVGFELDRRTLVETDGATLRYSVSGSISNAVVEGVGGGYYVVDNTGTEVSSYPATVDAVVLGTESFSATATVRVTVNANGTISPVISVISPGNGYFDSEYLELLPLCGEGDNPDEDKCLRYTGSLSLAKVYPSANALIQNAKYTYSVRFSDSTGFFLFDTKTDKWVYLGAFYNTAQQITGSMVLSRSDRVEPDNIGKLYNLNARSFFYDYRYSYQPSDNLSSNLKTLTETVEQINSDLSLITQNSQPYRLSTDISNRLGITYNMFEGRNISSDYRVIFRDPDSVLDQGSIDFFTIRDTLSGQNQFKVGEITIPGIWLFAGDKYQRVFSSDDKPFFSIIGRNYLSPAIYNQEGNELPSSGSLKYSISASYRNPVTETVRGFDTEIGTLVQSLTGGGLVYHRTLVAETLGSGVFAWPLLSYLDSNGTTQDAKFLAI